MQGAVSSRLGAFRRWAGSPWSDVPLAAVVALVQLWPLLSTRPDDGVPWHWWGYVAAAGSALPLVVRRLAPLPVLLVSLTVGSMYDLADHVAGQPLWYGAFVALYTVAAHSGRRVRLVALTFNAVGGMATVGSADTALRGVVLCVTAYALGRAAAGSRARNAALEERAVRLENERRLESERAAERERARIARDMHDVLAHAVSLMVVQAESGPVIVHRDPDQAAAIFDNVAATGRDAMDQLRRMLGALREGAGGQEGSALRVPQPTLDDLPTLAAQVAGAGLEVSCETEGEPRPLPSDCGVAAYRIAQEALTNVVKHAGARRVGIRLRWREEDLMIEIVDDGRGVAAQVGAGVGAGAGVSLGTGLEARVVGRPSSAGGLPSGGNGLIGIRERAAACGGTASAGPGPDGRGFQVRASLPLGGAS